MKRTHLKGIPSRISHGIYFACLSVLTPFAAHMSTTDCLALGTTAGYAAAAENFLTLRTQLPHGNVDLETVLKILFAYHLSLDAAAIVADTSINPDEKDIITSASLKSLRDLVLTNKDLFNSINNPVVIESFKTHCLYKTFEEDRKKDSKTSHLTQDQIKEEFNKLPLSQKNKMLEAMSAEPTPQDWGPEVFWPLLSFIYLYDTNPESAIMISAKASTVVSHLKEWTKEATKDGIDIFLKNFGKSLGDMAQSHTHSPSTQTPVSAPAPTPQPKPAPTPDSKQDTPEQNYKATEVLKDPWL